MPVGPGPWLASTSQPAQQSLCSGHPTQTAFPLPGRFAWNDSGLSAMIAPATTPAPMPTSLTAEAMHRRLPLLLRAIAYGLRGGFLVRPFVIALALGAAGAVLSSLEEQIPTLGAWVPATLFPSRQDPQVAQVILSVIATSIMTVVSIVFAMLLMTLTLASMQFSPRILISFVRDRGTQWTLGDVPRHVLLLHGGAAGGALAAAAVRAGGHRHRRHAAGAGFRRLADVLHPPHLAVDQRQPHRRSHRAGNRAGDRRADAASARTGSRR